MERRSRSTALEVVDAVEQLTGRKTNLKALHLFTASLHRLAHSPGSKFNRHGGSILNWRQQPSATRVMSGPGRS